MWSLLVAHTAATTLHLGSQTYPNLCLHPPNDIVRENCLAGSSASEWDVNGDGDPTIQGFAHDISVLPGGLIVFKVRTDSLDYRIDIYRLGFYQGKGARLVTSLKPDAQLPQQQPPCNTDLSTYLYDCGNWRPSGRWQVPETAVSGLYIARLVRQDNVTTNSWRADNSQYGSDLRFAKPSGNVKPIPESHAYGALGQGRMKNPLTEPRASHIYFIVRRSDKSTADVLFQTSDTTWQAYNHHGGTSTYGSYDPTNPLPRCFESSYNRPLATRSKRAINAPLSVEYPMIRWLEANGFDVAYQAGLDTHRLSHSLLHRNYKLFLSVGHDEYWSGLQRANVKSARDKGLNMAFLSGNEMFWRVRWEPSRAGGEFNSGLRTMVCYKESQDDVKIDPNQYEWTGTFRDARSINPLGAAPENEITGLIFTVNAWRNDPLMVPFKYSQLRMWRNTSVAKLQKDQVAVLSKGILGHEWDEDLDNGFRPLHSIRLSETTVDNVMYIMDHGSVYDSGSGTHHLVVYRAPSGALVFGAGTVQWAWGLDAHHDLDTGAPANMANILNIRVGEDLNGPESDLQQLTMNIFSDMGVLPTTMATHLVRPSPSTDHTPPSSSMVGMPSEESLVWVFEALDTQGEVGMVEVTFDNDRWWAANRQSQTRWTLNSNQPDMPLMPTMVCWRAVDDSFNVETEKCTHFEL